MIKPWVQAGQVKFCRAGIYYDRDRFAHDQTAGLALASDRASDENRPRVVALLYVMFLVGMGISALIIGWLLRDFTSLLLIRVVQGAAIVGLLLNLIALWKQESIKPMSKEDRSLPKPVFREAFSDLIKSGQTARLICVVFLGTIAFNMQMFCWSRLEERF